MGKVRFVKDNKMAWFIYNGTSDFAYPRLFNDYGEFYKIAWENGKGYNTFPKCSCDEEDEAIEIYESYGSGMLWKGRACRKCMLITKNLEPSEKLRDENFPEWCEKDFKNKIYLK